MPEDKPEIIKLDCPVCKGKHEYSVRIYRSPIFYKITSGMDTSTQFVKIKRIFSCPNENKEFQATLRIPRHFGEVIDGVEVGK